MSELTAVQIADAFKAKATIENGKIPTAKDFVESLLPEDLSADTIKRVFALRDTVIQGVVQGASDVGVEAAKKDPELSQITTTVPFFGDKIDVAITRQKTYPNPSKPGEQITKHGVLDVRYTARGALPKQGDLKTTAESVRDAWAGLSA